MRIRTLAGQFRDSYGRAVLLRGINLGGDCKVPYPAGGTHVPTDFSDHRRVSFIGRPFPLDEADEHFGRLRAWGFNCLRLLTTWEAVEHEGPGRFDQAYLDYFEEVAAKAGEYGLQVFVDFHQDVWSRMTGGDGAPGWTFEALGLDFRRFHRAGAAHVMQAKYDFARGGRQEERYPMMTWGQNYRMPGNAIPWTLFFAGRLLTRDFYVDGRNVQDFLQGHYLGAMAAVAKRLRTMPHVMGFDTLNEPSTGWIGKPLTYRHVLRSAEHPHPVAPGPAWSPLDGLLVAQGQSREIPLLSFDPAQMKVTVTGSQKVNEARERIWRDGVECPFAAAGAYDPATGAGHEEFFSHRDARRLDPEADAMVPFFNRVAETVRAINPDWLVFAEFDPFQTQHGQGFPAGCPQRMVNASHWYDIVTLVTKTFMYPTAINPFNGKTLEGRGAILEHYKSQLAKIKAASDSLPGGAPTLIGEFGIPFDLDDAAAYKAWRSGNRDPKIWARHETALDLMYEAMDALLLHTAHWNYTASNRNDLAIGDGWNQEDLSVFSRDQEHKAAGVHSGGRAVKGFSRPFARAVQGDLTAMSFDMASGTFRLNYTCDPSIAAPTEIFVPRIHYPEGVRVETEDHDAELLGADQIIRLRSTNAGPKTVRLFPRTP